MIGIIDIGLGNIKSVEKCIKRLGLKTESVSNGNDLIKYHKVFFPGVGHYDKAMTLLRARRMIEPIVSHINNGNAYLGICLGMQVLFEHSDEGLSEGIGILKGRVKAFTSLGDKYKIRIPHTGWNKLEKISDDTILSTIPNRRFYFSHSYYVSAQSKYSIASAIHGVDISAAIRHKNCYGVQFHPEKSLESGMEFLNNFVKI